MDIGRLQSPEPGGRKDPKIEQTRDGKKLDARKVQTGRGPSFEAQDSVSLSPEAIELRAEVEGFVEQLRRKEQGAGGELDSARLAEIRNKLGSGHYEQAAVLESAARRLHSGLNNGLDGMALPSE